MSIQALNWAFQRTEISKHSVRFVLTALANFANENNECFPSIQRISAMTGLAPRSVQRSLNWLTTKGYISRERRRSGDRNISNIYVIHIPPTEHSHSDTVSLSNKADSDTVSLSDRVDSDTVTLSNEVDSDNDAISDSDTVSFKPKEEEPLGFKYIGAENSDLKKSTLNTKPVKNKKGTRRPADFVLTDDRRRFALEQMPRMDVELEFANFIDYWDTAPDAKAFKKDWDAAWRMWVRNAVKYSSPRKNYESYKQQEAERSATSLERRMQLQAELRETDVFGR